MAFELPPLTSDGEVGEPAVQEDGPKVLDTLSNACLLRRVSTASGDEDGSVGSTGDHVVIFIEDGEGEVKGENLIQTEEMYGG